MGAEVSLRSRSQSGVSLLEMMVSVLVFTLLAGAAFGLLIAAQQEQKTESQLLDSFQAARLSLDQVVRDVSDAGYPPITFFSTAPPLQNYAQTPFAWDPNYPNNPCLVGTSCTTPGPYDLIIETNIDPQNDNGVDWLRYELQGTTLYRGVVSKTNGGNPTVATSGALVPYVENVVNNPPAALLAQLQANYPSIFSGGQPVPVFSYSWGSDPTIPHTPNKILDVNVTLIVMSKELDAKTGQPRVAELNGRARRLNPVP